MFLKDQPYLLEFEGIAKWQTLPPTPTKRLFLVT